MPACRALSTPWMKKIQKVQSVQDTRIPKQASESLLWKTAAGESFLHEAWSGSYKFFSLVFIITYTYLLHETIIN